MSNHFYKDLLYPLQDRVLKQVAASDTPFYMTGGTVLGRFLLLHRYSDDLDFFLNAASDFRAQIEKLIEFLNLTFRDIRMNNLQDSFARYYIVEEDLQLKLEYPSTALIIPYMVELCTKTDTNVQCPNVLCLDANSQLPTPNSYILTLNF